MSVIKSKRTISQYEYAFNFEKVYTFTEKRLSRLAKRKYKWLGEPITKIMNDIHKDIFQMNNRYFNYGIKEKPIQEQAQYVEDKFKSLQQPLFALWDIESYEERKMKLWCDTLNEEIKLISDYGNMPYNENDRIYYYTYKSVNDAEFLKTMSELHRFIYAKTISLPSYYRDTRGNILMDLADMAWYSLLEANRQYPTTKEICKNRIKRISIAIDCIQQMQMSTFSLFNTMKYSEKTMFEWSALLSKELKLLYGLLRSDKAKLSKYE